MFDKMPIGVVETTKAEEKETEEFLSMEDHIWLQGVKDDFDQELLSLSEGKHLDEQEIKLKDPGTNFLQKLKSEKRSAGKDRLTQLANRRDLFLRGVDLFNEAELSTNQHIAVMSFDVDYFKAYNAISHTFGDIALQSIAYVLLQATRDVGFSVRLGGEEIFLLVDNSISQEEVTRKAEKLQTEIQRALESVFDMLDERKGVPGITKKFLADSILVESRNRLGFNQERVLKPKFHSAKEIAKYKLGLEFDDNIQPADFMLLINTNYYDSKSEDVARIVELMDFSIGTVTMSALSVNFEQPSKVNSSDAEEIKEIIDTSITELKLSLEEIQEMSYPEVVSLIEASLPGVYQETQDSISQFLLKLKARRFGKIIDYANRLTEDQKKQKRNSLVFERKQISDFDREDTESRDVTINTAYQRAEVRLEELLSRRVNLAHEKGTPLVSDQLAVEYLEVQDDLDDAPLALYQLTDLHKEKFINPLTRSFNYKYLTDIVPEQIKQADNLGENFTMVSFDIDNLKAINETCGHKMGDIILMEVSLFFLEILENLPEELAAKVRSTGISPSLIRSTGGEEFIITLPGVSSTEAIQFMKKVNEQLKKRIRKITDKVSPSGETYTKKIQNFIRSLDFQTNDGRIIKRAEEELDKFGTVTAGVVDLAQVKDQIKEEDGFNSGKMRQIADLIGEKLKSKIEPDSGVSGRGGVWGLDNYQVAS